MLDIPAWADLGDDISEQVTDLWAHQMGLLTRYEHYYSGSVFFEYVEKETPSDPDVPLFPAGINLVKILCTNLSDTVFGEWETRPVNFKSHNKTGADSLDQDAIDLVNDIMDASNFASAIWEGELDRNRYGGCALRVSVANEYPYIRWSRVRRDGFFPVWDPENPDKLMEVWAVSLMAPEQVRLKFGAKPARQRSVYVEHWSNDRYDTRLNDIPLASGYNPFRLTPFVFIPRIRTNYWWGDAITEDIIPLQDELNMGIGDIGDVIRKNAHPITYGYNIPSGFKKEIYKTNSDSMWDFGRQTGELEPHVGVLETKGNVLGPASDQVKFLLRMARDHAGTPAIAYGDDDGGGQRSGDTLEIRLRPIMAAARRSRSYLSTGLKQLLKITSIILAQKQFPEVPARVPERIAKLSPTYAEVLPRSRQSLVDEIVKLLSTDPPSISLETAVILLGRGTKEIDLIKSMIKDEELRKQVENENNFSDGRALPVSGREGEKDSSGDNKKVQSGPKNNGV